MATKSSKHVVNHSLCQTKNACSYMYSYNQNIVSEFWVSAYNLQDFNAINNKILIAWQLASCTYLKFTPMPVEYLRLLLSTPGYSVLRIIMNDFQEHSVQYWGGWRHSVSTRWTWSVRKMLPSEKAFATLKELLTSAPVLVYPKFGPDQSFILETDASQVGLGAVLSQTQEDGCICISFSWQARA